MTSSGGGWLGIGGLVALAGLGWLVGGAGGTVRNPRPGEPVTLVKRARSKRDAMEGTHTILTFSDGSTRKIQRLRAWEAHGLGGWHYADTSELNTWLADSEADAIAEILRRKNR